MPRHIFRLILVILVCVVVGYGAKRFFTVNSFYEYGHYRGDSVADIASDKPKFKGVGYCASCHAKQTAEWSNGVHNSSDIGKIVKCEVCHGAGGERDVLGPFEASATGADHPNNLKMVVPTDTRKLCTFCHERMTGRPLQQRQIVVADHAGTQQCIVCHNPHSPKLNLTPVAEAAAQAGDPIVGKAKAAACAGCHGAEGVSRNLPGPSLAGQNAAYFAEALKAYGTGGRNNPMMSPAAQGMNAEDTGHLAAYFSGLKCEAAPASDAQAVSAGKAIASKCTACHGADGRAGNGAWPNLAGQSKDYLVNAIKAYKGGARNNGMMAGIVKDLNDSDAESVATYYASAACK
ncbi:c-type cytochrome [Bradyrhizobium sp.]|uniref:c-type cytochrome n=1 Tax=Bradyrhizobium sp. TaxID=376 RepID=UPI0025B7BE2C|nr:c-type cytochrome [Bradyrhizobium sp.]HWJ18457.1 c-type cytochrome [Geobacterales bacterium]